MINEIPEWNGKGFRWNPTWAFSTIFESLRRAVLDPSNFNFNSEILYPGHNYTRKTWYLPTSPNSPKCRPDFNKENYSNVNWGSGGRFWPSTFEVWVIFFWDKVLSWWRHRTKVAKKTTPNEGVPSRIRIGE